MTRHFLRNATRKDLSGIFEISSHLDTLNLPADRSLMAEMLEISDRSFMGSLPVDDRIYVFVVEDIVSQRIVATSQIIAKHGTPDSPHLYFEVLPDEKYSSTTQQLFQHKMLKLNKSFNGPTELAGLVVEPELRRSKEKIGRQISYVRFMFMAMFPELFQRQLIAELLPPMVNAHSSLMWDAIGHRFTGMSYREADLLSRTNKEFIISLFPEEPIHLALLAPELSLLVAQTGENTKGAHNMLLDAGLVYKNHIDPFDGGPHLEANCSDVLPIKHTQRRILNEEVDFHHKHHGLVAIVRNPFSPQQQFSAVCCQFFLSHDQSSVHFSPDTQKILNIEPGEAVYVLPL